MTATIAPDLPGYGIRDRPTPRSNNNFGALRLLFATLVILSHSFELIDGSRTRELLTRLFGTLSFGELGVDGFFLISGYLITKSWLESGSSQEYLFKRILRIYPGYIAAYLICVVVVAPFVGGDLTALSGPVIFADLVFLRPPDVPGVFAGTPFPMLNGPMWTIAYEFRCYLLVLAVGLIGLFSRRRVILIAVAVFLAVPALAPGINDRTPPVLLVFVGLPETLMTFAGVFGCGALFYLYRDRIRYRASLAFLAALGLAALMPVPRLAIPAVAILGGYVLFWLAFAVNVPAIATIGRRVDLSYGVYLYAWPAQKLLIWGAHENSPWLLFVEATAIAGLIAYGSWRLVEKPCLNLKAAIRNPARLAEPRRS